MTAIVERVLSVTQRRQRARAMHRNKQKLVRQREIKRHKLASNDVLLRRAEKMARAIFRKKLAGSRGANYQKLSPTEKVEVDKLIDPKLAAIRKLAVRLLPVVRRAEMKRFEIVKGIHGEPTTPLMKSHTTRKGIAEEMIDEISLRDLPRLKAQAERSVVKRKIGRQIRKHRHGSEKAKRRKAWRTARDNALELKGIRNKGDTYGNFARRRFARGVNTDPWNDLMGRADLARLDPSTAYDMRRAGRSRNNRLVRNLYNSVEDAEVLIIAECLLEGDKSKLDKLLTLGLVDKKKLEVYKRVMSDPKAFVRMQQYREKILDVLDKLVTMITTNDPMYQRARQEIVKKRVDESKKIGYKLFDQYCDLDQLMETYMDDLDDDTLNEAKRAIQKGDWNIGALRPALSMRSSMQTGRPFITKPKSTPISKETIDASEKLHGKMAKAFAKKRREEAAAIRKMRKQSVKNAPKNKVSKRKTTVTPKKQTRTPRKNKATKPAASKLLRAKKQTVDKKTDVVNMIKNVAAPRVQKFIRPSGKPVVRRSTYVPQETMKPETKAEAPKSQQSSRFSSWFKSSKKAEPSRPAYKFKRHPWNPETRKAASAKAAPEDAHKKEALGAFKAIKQRGQQYADRDFASSLDAYLRDTDFKYEPLKTKKGRPKIIKNAIRFPYQLIKHLAKQKFGWMLAKRRFKKKHARAREVENLVKSTYAKDVSEGIQYINEILGRRRSIPGQRVNLYRKKVKHRSAGSSISRARVKRARPLKGSTAFDAQRASVKATQMAARERMKKQRESMRKQVLNQRASMEREKLSQAMR